MNGKLQLGILASLIVGITLLHNLSSIENPVILNIVQKLYYLPIILGAFFFGLKGALPASVISTFLYPHHGHTHWPEHPFFTLNQYAEMFMFNLIGITTGLLADFGKKTQKKYESTAGELKAAYEKLQNSFEQIRAADRLSSLGVLSAGVAHEIRNPLSSIKGSIEILEDDYSKKNKKYEFIQIIKKEITRLENLITEFLIYARPARPQMDDNNINEIVRSIITLLKQGGGGESGFNLKLAQNLPRIRVDSEQIKQALLNVILNGVHASSEELIVESGTTGDFLYVSVKDYGPGVPKESMDKLFDPFFTTKDNGTGLGLSITLQIIKAHGGDIRVTNLQEGGADFTILLPLKKNE